MAKEITLLFSPPQRKILALTAAPGHIVMISDASGILPSGWELALTTPSDHAPARFVDDGRTLPRTDLCFVGFDETLPEMTVREYLSTFSEDIDALIYAFDLKSVAALNCAYLPAMVTRQVLLLHATESGARALVLNDPFLPFNGRWREAFAERLLARTEALGLTVICCNINFSPTSWGASPLVRSTDMATLLPISVEGKVAQAAATAAKGREVNSCKEAYYAPSMKIAVPTTAISIYSAARDRIFVPLAQASTFLRTWSGAVVAGSVAFLIVAMGVVMVPNIAKSRELLASMGQRLGWPWGDVKDGVVDGAKAFVNGAEKADAAKTLQKAKSEGSPEKGITSDPEVEVALLTPSSIEDELGYRWVLFSTPLSAKITLKCEPFDNVNLRLLRSAEERGSPGPKDVSEQK
jgi:hypothetical protein